MLWIFKVSSISSQKISTNWASLAPPSVSGDNGEEVLHLAGGYRDREKTIPGPRRRRS